MSDTPENQAGTPGELLAEAIRLMKGARENQKLFYRLRGSKKPGDRPEAWEAQKKAIQFERLMDEFLEQYEQGQGRLF